MLWPDNKDFAFTIIDDTDAGTVENSKPVYDFLYEKGIITTKTVWVFPSRDEFKGESLSDHNYRDFISDLSDKGFEIASHGPGSGDFTSEETINSFEKIKDLVGYHPKIFINHAFNKGNIYWAGSRFSSPISKIFLAAKTIRRDKIAESYGEIVGSPYFWGDYAKKNIKYMRNHVFTGLDTLKYDKHTPFKEKKKDIYSNYWFSSSDGYDCHTFNRLLDPKNVDKLVENHGCAIVYTHFGYGFADKGALNETFKERIEYLYQKNGWFVPAGELLDYLEGNKAKDVYLSSQQKLKLDLKWLLLRIIRKICWRV
ncbi:hypothetical protein [Alkalibacter mobilis]|uniref:hypothetical protein n=1 Tax=Alkalibacter mobilis TaxID=2787712 RepID=UPI00189CF11E|nr:hypothetical protein [Alkalibacter mobilis]MBF7097334.1 hypothetical protein [Alkalibacter mobilis]